jgi:hypothetical protein
MEGSGVTLGLVGVVIGLLIGIAFGRKRSGNTAETEDGASMPTRYRQVLVGYLLIVGVGIVWMVVSLTSVEIPEPALLPEARSVQPAALSADKNTPLLLEIFPQWTLGSSSPTVSVGLYGQNFTRDSKVRVNMKSALRPANFVASDLLKFDLKTEDLVGVGSISLEIVNGERASNALVLPVVKPQALLNVFGLRVPITREVQLLLLVIVAGALGSYLHAIKSLTDFIGNRTLTASWYWWYISRPFLGMAMGTIFYAVLRGGFLAGTPADAKVVNPFGVVAIGALVGMFADKAAQKLAEIFETLFRAEDQRGGKLTAPIVDRLDPPSVVPGSPAPVLKLIGERLGKISGVRLNADERKPDTVSEKEVTVKLRPEDVANSAQIKITAVNPDGGASPAVTLHVTTLAITAPAALHDATVGTDWTETLTASGGSAPYKWSLTDGPSWLGINNDTGELKGRPKSRGVEKVSVKLSDAAKATAPKIYDLRIV